MSSMDELKEDVSKGQLAAHNFFWFIQVETHSF